ncbi:MAG: hypothetical protein COA78_24730 [Blastopirellula sp.]|nr:MAG: hypothetical protein COA78_24730 [Blastopirellula sp.]
MIIHTTISGFTQDHGSWHGVLELTEKLREKHCEGVRSRVHYYRWDENWAAIAEYYWSLSEKYHTQPLIAIYAYSWGAGHGAMRLTEQLRKRGLRVRLMVLADPVYRNVWCLWRSMRNWNLPWFGEPIIRVPDYVDEVFSFHQVQNRPSGHKLLPESRTGGPTIHPPVLLTANHQYMDNAGEFHAKCLEQASRLCREARTKEIK